jgi:thiamine pyrophosphokinase
MKALIVAAAPVTGSPRLVARLAPTFDPVIAVDGGGSICIDAGVVPDVLLGDFDSIDPAALEWLQGAGARVLTFPADKDQTDLELALDYARSVGVTSVTVTAASSGRLDHTLGALGALAAASALSPELIEPELTAWILALDGRAELLAVGLGATISLVAFGGDAVVSVAGVRWPLDRHVLSPAAALGISNVVTSESGAKVTLHSGVVLALAPRMPHALQIRAK